MNKRDYIALVDGLRAPDSLRRRIAALPSAQKTTHTRRPGRWLSLAACLVLVVGAAAFLPSLLRGLNTGGDLQRQPVVTDAQPTPSGEYDLVSLLAAQFPDPAEGDTWELLFAQTVGDNTLGVLSYAAAAHAGGFGNLIFGVFDGAGDPVGNVMLSRGDAGILSAWYDHDGTTKLVFTNYSKSQGWQDCIAGLYSFSGGVLSVVKELPERARSADLPEGALTMFDPEQNAAFWEDHKAVLNGAGLGLYHRDPERGSASNDAWVFDCYLTLNTGSSSVASTDQVPEGFENYAAPILPLTVSPGEQEEELNIKRSLTFDFTDRMEGAGTIPVPRVTDRYTIRNTTGVSQSASFFYPWAGTLSSPAVPTVSGGGRPVPGTSPAGFEVDGRRVDGLYTWEDYKTILSSEPHSYLGSSLFPPTLTLRDIPAKVYSLEQIQGCAQEVRDTWGASLAVELSVSPDAQVFTYGFNGLAQDGGWRRYDFFLNSYEDGAPHLLIVLGGEIEGWSVAGYEDGSCEPDKRIPGLTGELVFQGGGLLGGVMQAVEDTYLYDHAPLENADDLSRVLCDLIQSRARGRAMADALQSQPYVDSRYDWARLEDMIGDARGEKRVFFYPCAVTVPAGGSVTIESSFYAYPSSNIALIEDEGKTPVYGWDLAQGLGSPLDLRALQVEVIPGEGIGLEQNNLALNQAAGVLSAPMNVVDRGWFTVTAAP